MDDRAVIEVDDAAKHFLTKEPGTYRRVKLRAVDGVSFEIRPGTTFGLVGESGCGKSTLAKLILGLEPLTSGNVRFRGVSLVKLSREQKREYRTSVQAVPQDPFDSLNPRMRIQDIVGEPLRQVSELTADDRRRRVAEALEMVGLPSGIERLYPHEFSGGQRQRIAIARAIATQSTLIVLDEATSALDVSIRAQIVNLLSDIRDQLGTSYFVISHDLHVVEFMSDIVAVMYLGKIVEMAPKAELRDHRLHPYTQALFDAIPQPDPDDPKGEAVVEGEPPDPAHPPTGCAFHPRCPLAVERCARELPLLREVRSDHVVACHLV